MGIKQDSIFPADHNPVWMLLLEDDETVRRLMSKMLEHLGFNVLTAARMVDAKQLCLSHPDITLFMADYGLGHSSNGAEFLRWAGERYPGRTRVLISGLSSEDIAHFDDITGDCDVMLNKPFNLTVLRTHMESFTEKWSGDRQMLSA